jgi:lysozyme family protein
MANFITAVILTLQHEGGYTNNPSDPGGATNMGIEQRDLPNTPIETLTQAQAIAYYSEHYWKPLYGEIEDQGVASKLFDLGVLFGVGTAVQMLQGVLKLTPIDGAFGPSTLAAVNEADPFTLLTAYKTVMVQHAMDIGSERPAERIFVVGWIRRINS